MVQKVPMGKRDPLLAPLLGELAAARPTEGSPVFSNCQEGKDSTARKNGTVHAVPFTLFNSQIRRRV